MTADMEALVERLGSERDSIQKAGIVTNHQNSLIEFPAISLWQPYASLIFTGHKRHETRGYRLPTKHIGKRIAIHATARFPSLNKISEELHELCMDVFGCGYNHTLPLGQILGTVIVHASGPISDTPHMLPLDEDDRTSGDWSHGRFAWPLSDIKKLQHPIPAKGKQGWWRATLRSGPESSFDQNPSMQVEPLSEQAPS